ncbi:riboflavin biosynthesis protein RibF [Ethanoligenens sp.]|uniref:riboflavin biosynthesis protein RibF n=1 Tax=Ethanoligenens sp. TaxID=2099655 RepID=UPI0039EC5639
MEIYHADKALDIREPLAVILGMFDGVHIGHAAVIRAARETGLRTALITFTEHPALVLKNRRAPDITTDRQRERIFEDLGIDYLIYLDFRKVQSLSPEEFIQKVLLPFHIRYAFCGFNYRFGEGGKAGPDVLDSLGKRYGFTAVRIPPICDAAGPVSSTRIRKLIAEGRMEDTATLLGRPFTLEFPVIHGRQLGRTLGTPTINQRIPEEHVCPRFGVYAASVRLDGEWRDAVASVGVKPTVGSDDILCETFLFDFDGDLYGRWMEVALHTFLRPEKRFDSIDALKTQMEQDIVQAKNWLLKNRPVPYSYLKKNNLP